MIEFTISRCSSTSLPPFYGPEEASAGGIVEGPPSRNVGRGGILVATRLPAYIFQKPAHCVELRAETRPVSGLQALHCLIVAVECLARPICRRACEWRSRCGTRGRRRSAGFEER